MMVIVALALFLALTAMWAALPSAPGTASESRVERTRSVTEAYQVAEVS